MLTETQGLFLQTLKSARESAVTPLPSDGQTDWTSKTEKPVSWPSGAGMTHAEEEETLSTTHLQQWKALMELMAASIR